MLRTRSPLSPGPKSRFSLDLHVLGAPPAFVLSQDQTLHRDHVARAPRREPSRTIGELPRATTLWSARQRCARRLRLAAGPSEHGIDMSLRPRKRVRRPHWLLAFTALFSRNGSPTDASSRARSVRASLRRDTHPSLRYRIGPEARSATRIEGVGVNVPPFRRPWGDSGVRGDWQDYRDTSAVSNSVAGVKKHNPPAGGSIPQRTYNLTVI